VQPLPESPYRLIVEGPDDKHSVIHLMARHGYNWDDEGTIRPYVNPEGGVSRLLEAIPVAIKGNYKRIGIILDANSNPLGRWAQVRDRARREGLEVPDSLQAEGVVISGRTPDSKFGVWLMPDNLSPGFLEHLLVELVPQGDLVWGYADEAVREARRLGARCSEQDHIKSRLRTWLAWQEEPGLLFGTALKARLLEHDSENARRFLKWFRKLFVEA
jgi:hypothetical protein